MKWPKPLPGKGSVRGPVPGRGSEQASQPSPAEPAGRWSGLVAGSAGVCCQLAGGGVAFCHNLVPSTRGGLAAAGPSGEQRKGRGRGQEAVSWSFFQKQFVGNVHRHSPTHSRLIGQEMEASGCGIEYQWRCVCRSAGRLLEPAQRCQAQLFSAMSFCHRNLGPWTWACELSASLRAHKLTRSLMQDAIPGPLPAAAWCWGPFGESVSVCTCRA